MRAIVRQAFGGPEQLRIEEVDRPEPGAGEVLVRVRAFGLNRAEQYFREGRWGDVAAISGIECAGEVAADPAGRLVPGQKVFALMGSLGRSRPGSYAEFVAVPAANVVPVRSALDWATLAALPETFATAWSCLHDNLAVRRGDVVVVRGATSALGRAAVQLAAHAGARVVAGLRRPASEPAMRALGATWCALDDDGFEAAVRELAPAGVDAVLDIVGSRTVLRSLALARRGGRVCWAGFLGGGEPLASVDPMRDLPSGRHLSFFASAFVFGTEHFPLTEVPLQRIVDLAEQGRLDARPARVFRFEEIQAAHALLDAGTSGGKIVVTVPGHEGG